MPWAKNPDREPWAVVAGLATEVTENQRCTLLVWEKKSHKSSKFGWMCAWKAWLAHAEYFGKFKDAHFVEEKIKERV